MIKLIPRIPVDIISRQIGYPFMLPASLTLSVTYKCNSRCKTCNITKRSANELTTAEWEEIFKKYRSEILWVTFSGGEPFLRRDIAEIAQALYTHCKPSVINFPTNGILTSHIADTIDEIAAFCRKSHIVVNVSIDDIGDRHDVIRGAKGSYEKACETINMLRLKNIKNMSIGIHTVVSRFNVDRIEKIYRELKKLKPDSLIAEIAEERIELQTMDSGITPEYTDYRKAVSVLVDKRFTSGLKGAGKLTRALRMEYHKIVQRILREKKQVIPCYAGFSSAQIAPDGDVWFCCIKADPVGNLREVDYDFKKVWDSDKARTLRTSIKRGDCYCPLANATYTNMLHHVPSVVKILGNYIKNN
jgi:MoaA/NifB/PqqE/SkfB family radical SAM enzyme